ncbi:Uma2 family endonuclease [Pseudanabaena sp. ABRG5-3]|uniref:Uma2 family endonuclease n=1 Tax=Pseudanabaena sp. ABRG5-3 TaxID=685565 RepID=UPI000DC72FFD|nr:Uma2 family endonuclease [Pseudanabaena sp. ABRG5-3]BBC23360.1 hypothetical protein ABRG53_1103 [Pseudanabaena sp. ABRG5-3]
MVAIVEKDKTLNQTIILNRWTTATWEEFLGISQVKSNDKAKFYYYQGQYYSENSLSAEHGANHYLTSFLVNLYCMMCKIPLKGLGSERITESSVLGGLRLSLLEEALQRSREIDNSQIGSWFMTQFSLER